MPRGGGEEGAGGAITQTHMRTRNTQRIHTGTHKTEEQARPRIDVT